MAQDGAPTTRLHATVQDFGVAPSVAFGLGTPTELTLSALLQHNHDAPDYGVSPLNGHPEPLNRFYGMSDDHTIQDIAAVNASVSHQVSTAVTVRNRLQLNTVDVERARNRAAEHRHRGARRLHAAQPDRDQHPAARASCRCASRATTARSATGRCMTRRRSAPRWRPVS